MHVWQSSNKYRELDHKSISDITASAIRHIEKVKEIRIMQIRLLGFDDLRQKGKIFENLRDLDGFLNKGKILKGSQLSEIQTSSVDLADYVLTQSDFKFLYFTVRPT